MYRIYSSAGAGSDVNVPTGLTVGKWYKVTFTIDSVASVGTIVVNDSGAVITASVGVKTSYVRALGSSLRIKRNSAVDCQISGVSFQLLDGNHASQANASNKPVLQQSGGLYYLQFDGVDDFLSTGNIDFTATDKMTVVAGVRKLSDAATAMLVELGSAGKLNIAAPDLGVSGQANFNLGASGTSNHSITTGFAALSSAVLSCTYDVAAAAGFEVLPRLNGVAATGVKAGDSGTGNLINAPLYIGRRGGTSLPFNGHLYQLVVRGALTADLTPGETFTAGKTGITL